MSLGHKTFAILFLTVVGLTAVLYATTRVLMLQNFLSLEQRETQSAVERAENALNDDIAKLAATTNDYGAWDRTYGFMQNPSPDYIRQEFKDQTLQGLGINSILLLGPLGKAVYFKDYDLLREQETESPAVQMALASDPWVRLVGASSTPGSGIFLLPQGPTLIAACPILTSERKGPARGVLVMTRHLDEALIARLKAGTRSSISVELAASPVLATDFQAARAVLQSNRKAITIQVRSESSVAGYGLLEDVSGKPALLLRVDMPRAVFQQGEASLRYFLGALCLASLVFGAVTMLLLRYAVLARLTHLNAEISRIGDGRDLRERVAVSGNDELSRLGGAINTMLEALQNGDTQFREISENIHQVFWVKDQDTQEVVYVSPPWESSSGLTRESLYSGSEFWLETIHPEDRSLVAEMLEKQRRGKKGEAEFRIVRPDETIWWIWCRYFPVFTAEGHLTETVGLSEDVTEYKNAEQTLLRSQQEVWNVMGTVAQTSPR
jgi:PAS domain S-box-containing protein